jgi:hypothetical protein
LPQSRQPVESMRSAELGATNVPIRDIRLAIG